MRWCENMFAETLVVLLAVPGNRKFVSRFGRGSLRNGHHVSGRPQARKVSEIAGKEQGPKILTSVQVLRC